MSTPAPAEKSFTTPSPPAILSITAAGAAVAVHFNVVADLWDIWERSPDYSHGFVVPLFSAFLVWRSRAAIGRDLDEPIPAWAVLVGVVACLGAVALRAIGLSYQITILEAIALLTTLAAVSLLCLGPRAAWRVAPAVAFLMFAVPLPGFVMTPIRLGLQHVATVCSTFALQTLGLPAVVVGNTIRLPEAVLGVAEACSGMRMLITFAAIVTGLCLVSRQPRHEKILALLAVVPITLAANVIRIVITGLVYNAFGDQAGEVVHDWAGFGMIAIGVGLLGLWNRFVGRVFRDDASPAATAAA